jgi:hypothetical protein
MAGKVFIHATMSLDGFIADPDGALDWAFKLRGPSAETVREIVGSIGAVLARRGAAPQRSEENHQERAGDQDGAEGNVLFLGGATRYEQRDAD